MAVIYQLIIHFRGYVDVVSLVILYILLWFVGNFQYIVYDCLCIANFFTELSSIYFLRARVEPGSHGASYLRVI